MHDIYRAAPGEVERAIRRRRSIGEERPGPARRATAARKNYAKHMKIPVRRSRYLTPHPPNAPSSFAWLPRGKMGIVMTFKMAASLTAAFLLISVAPSAEAQTTPAGDGSDKAALPPAAATPAEAPAAASPFTITGSAAIVSQYRFRGISQSDNKPVAQGTFTVAHSSGFYLSTWGSSASANDAVNIGGTEIDVYGGYTHALGKSGVTIDAGLYGYIYPGSRKAVGISESYYEVYGSLSKPFGPVTAKVGVYWAPDQHYFDKFATPTQYNVYEYGELSLALPNFPVSFHSHIGHTGGGFDYAGHDYIDYAAGASYKWKALTFDLSVVGTNLSRKDTRPFDAAAATTDFHRAAKTVLVGSVTASF